MKRITIAATVVLAVATTGLIASGDQGGTQVQRVPQRAEGGAGNRRDVWHRHVQGDHQQGRHGDRVRADVQRSRKQRPQAHIHIGYPQNAGAIVLWLCESRPQLSWLGRDAALQRQRSARQPQRHGLGHADRSRASWLWRPTAAPTWDEVVSLIRDGRTYANVHTATFGAGEIRSQIDSHDGHSGPRRRALIDRYRRGAADVPRQRPPRPLPSVSSIFGRAHPSRNDPKSRHSTGPA